MNTKAILLSVFILVSCLLQAQVSDSVRYENVGPEDFLSMVRFRDNVILLDVRLPFEFRKEKIEGAINMPVARKFRKKILKFDKESLLLVYCTTGVRSGWAAEKLLEMGFRKVYNLEGGIEGWKRKGLAVEEKKGGRGEHEKG